MVRSLVTVATNCNTNEFGRYVIERSPTYMKVWFWSRSDPSVPGEVANGGQYVNPDTWVRSVIFFSPTTFN